MQVKEITLKNGLRVCLKKSTLEPGEFDFQLFAIGGYGHLPVGDQPSGWLAADIAWESGLDQKSIDELECALDDHSIEMSVKLGLFDRRIQATGPTDELKYCLRLTHLFFTDPQFTEGGLKEALTQARRTTLRKNQTPKMGEDQTALKINFRNWHLTAPFNLLDLDKVELHKAKRLFQTFFHNPAEFIFIIVGDFDEKEVMQYLEESLGSLPSSPVVQWSEPRPPSFPQGVTKKEFTGVVRYRDSLTRLTFSLPPQAKDPITLDLLCHLFKQELLSDPALSKLNKNCFNVSYSFPLFPYLEPCWLVIKFSSTAAEISSLCDTILKKMGKLKQEGITEEKVKLACQELDQKRDRISDNAYFLSLLTDCYQAGWDIKQLSLLTKKEQQEKELLKKVMECYPNLDQYSMVLLHP